LVKQLKDVQRAQISALIEEGFHPAEVAEKFGVHRTSVDRTVEKYKKFGIFGHKGGNGRPKKLSLSTIKQIKREIKIKPKNSLRKIAKTIEQKHGKKISHVSIKKALNSEGLYAFSPIRKPLLRENHIRARLEFASEVIAMSDKKIQSILFSDESKFEILNPGRVGSVWRKPGTGLKNEHLVPTVKFGGGSVMVWGCFSYQGVGRLVFIEEIMNADKYVNILSNNLIQSAEDLGMADMIFQQDNDPKHTSRVAKEYFTRENIKLLSWPSQSPDMNPIENLWAIIKDKVADLQPKSKLELKEAIERAWSEITPETCQNLVLSFRKRASMLKNAEGHHIPY